MLAPGLQERAPERQLTTMEQLLARGQAATAAVAGPAKVRWRACSVVSGQSGDAAAIGAPALPHDPPPLQGALTAAEAERVVERLKVFDIEEVSVGSGHDMTLQPIIPAAATTAHSGIASRPF